MIVEVREDGNHSVETVFANVEIWDERLFEVVLSAKGRVTG